MDNHLHQCCTPGIGDQALLTQFQQGSPQDFHCFKQIKMYFSPKQGVWLYKTKFSAQCCGKILMPHHSASIAWDRVSNSISWPQDSTPLQMHICQHPFRATSTLDTATTKMLKSWKSCSSNIKHHQTQLLSVLLF